MAWYINKHPIATPEDSQPTSNEGQDPKSLPMIPIIAVTSVIVVLGLFFYAFQKCF
jgi:hypothetical protein